MDNLTQHVITILHLLSATYGHTFGTEQSRAYVATLADIDGALLKAATLRFIENNVYPRIPTPGELRQYAAEIVTQAQGLPPGSEAWGEVTRALRYTGSWGNPAWENALIAQAVQDVGGWLYLCMSENPAADRARFIAAYDERLKRRTRDMMQLPASAQYGERLAEGLRRDPAVLIADAARRLSARRVPQLEEA
ncbi:protein of unknown function [Candidatus Promineifilum breve]|uniref:Replicative helicase inhibitor G39P N-terminal domain-containing protein n=1 Tax=Candidatus Promineifilum breve TaxID=1806508 RepID=A0A160T6B9_9CHLR|nr:protein of unknown function [Candidatus Promineifilum breve]